MSNTITQLTDKSGNNLYPTTHATAVFSADGRSVEERLNSERSDRQEADLDLQSDVHDLGVAMQTMDAAMVRSASINGGNTIAPDASGKLPLVIPEISSFDQRISALEQSRSVIFITYWQSTTPGNVTVADVFWWDNGEKKLRVSTVSNNTVSWSLVSSPSQTSLYVYSGIYVYDGEDMVSLI